VGPRHVPDHQAIVVVFAMVFGGFMLAGGPFRRIIKAAPFEMMMIGGAAIGAFLIGNSFKTVMAVGGGFGKIMGGAKWKPKDYTDLLSLLFGADEDDEDKGRRRDRTAHREPQGSPRSSRTIRRS